MPTISFTLLTAEHLHELSVLLPDMPLVLPGESMEKYTHDETEDLRFAPEAVALPGSVDEVSKLLAYCHGHRIPLTPRGAGTGLSGGSLARHGGVMVSLERMNRIVAIDEANLQARVQAGVITQHLIDAAAEKGLLYPIDPASKGSSFIGGNIAHGSGGPRVVKYGTIRDYVLNLQVVLPDGEVIWTGADTLKNSSGYSLTQLFIASEGTLGIITEAVVKLLPKPATDLLMLASFPSNEQACAAVSAVFRGGFLPSALEFMERRGVEWVIEHEGINFTLADEAQAYLLIEVDGDNLDYLYGQCEGIHEVLERFGCLEVLLADTAAQKEGLWRMRRVMGHSVKANSVYKEEDTVVPRASLPQLIAGVKQIGRQYGFESVCYGHAGDGNLHINIIKGAMDDRAWSDQLPLGIRAIFELAVSLGGTISGEHGIGLVQRDYLGIKYSERQLALMRGVKGVFDPHGIMNPGKIF